MKLIREISTNKVYFLVPDGENVELHNNYAIVGNTKVLGMSSSTHELVENVQEPDLYVGGGALTYDDNGWGVDNQEALSEALTKLVEEFKLKVDKEVDDIIFAVVGNRTTEYLRAEEEALAFQAANFQGDVPPSVAADAAANGTTPEQSALSIIAMASQWRDAQNALRLNRLTAKANADNATTNADLNAAKSQWNQFVIAIKQQLGLDSQDTLGQ